MRFLEVPREENATGRRAGRSEGIRVPDGARGRSRASLRGFSTFPDAVSRRPSQGERDEETSGRKRRGFRVLDGRSEGRSLVPLVRCSNLVRPQIDESRILVCLLAMAMSLGN